MISKDAIKPFIILLLCMMLAGVYFWTTSRYPDLSGKSMMGTNAPTSSIGFAPIIAVDETMPVWQKILAETVNWVHTNKKGMSFAFIFGSFFLSLWPLLTFRAFKSGFINSALGTFLGAPLGVCVNCAAPIARSIHASGGALQTTLSALVASPTLNIVVIMMAFTVFPFYMAALKVALTLLFILIIVPVACHLFFKKEIENQQLQEVCEITQKTKAHIPKQLGWMSALLWSIKTYAKNFIYLLKIALPLMLLSGLLGAALTVFVPWGMIETLSVQDNVLIIIALLAAVSVFGALLPSPMAFDVVISAALLQAGVPVSFVAAFLFTLGSFSIYAFFILWQAISLRVASFMMGTTILLGIVAGFVAMPFENRTLNKNQTELIQLIKDESHDPIFARTDKEHSYTELKPLLKRHKVKYKTLPSEHENLKIQYTEIKPKSRGEKPFSFYKGTEFGIQQPYTISYLTGPSGAVVFSTMSIASGDVHKDGWPDLLIMGDHEVRPNLVLYANIGGRSFKRQEIPMPENIDEVILASLADLNADGWLDIVFATLNGKNFVIYNDQGAFKQTNLSPLHADLNGTTMSISYGDIEGDGNLDIFLGNWSVGPHFVNYSRSQNALLKQNENAEFEKQMLDGVTGETLTSMFTDINQDGLQDVYVGNDHIWNDSSDFILLGTEDGELKPAGASVNKSLLGTHSTMSIDSTDLDQDGTEEYYIAQIAYAGQYMQEMSKIADKQIAYEDYCIGKAEEENCASEMQLKLALARASNFVSDACDILDNEDHKRKCLLHLFMNTRCGYNRYAQNEVEQKQLEGIQPSQRYKRICDYQEEAMKEKKQREEQNLKEPILIKSSNNSLNNVFLKKKEKAFQDLANQRKIGFGAWTWNARWADLDNDGDQDLYLVNGFSMPMALPANIFYQNDGTGNFTDQTEEFGLESYTPTSAFSYLDIDNDGDMDIVTVPTDSELEVFQNHTQNDSIQFQLLDETSNNTYAIGAEVRLTYEHNGETKTQSQKVKASGGYKSYNQYILNFGLPENVKVIRANIIWGRKTKAQTIKNLNVNKRFLITRK